jgi:putative Mg2+ transporter-C (MgtC) family protein
MITEQEIVLRLLLGALFGGIIGFERQVHGRPAGFRTHMLVCLALALLMIVSENYHFLITKDPSYIRVDPARIAMGAITGVGFIGAGVIVKTGVSVHGLTTAASLWMVSAIGLAMGSGLYMAGTWAFVITFFALFVLRIVEGKMARMSFVSLMFVAAEGFDEKEVFDALSAGGAVPHNIDYEKDNTTGEVTYRMTIALKHRISNKPLLDSIASIAGIKRLYLKRG